MTEVGWEGEAARGAPADRPDPAASPDDSAVVLVIGDIGVTRSQVVTPAGSCDLRSTTWTAQANVTTRQTTPAWAVVLAVIFFFACLLGLLCLLVKRTKTSGWVEVTVQGPGLFYGTRVPVSSSLAVASVQDQVNQARSLAARAPGATGASGTPGPGVTFDESRSYWYDGTTWRDTRIEIPPGTTVDADAGTWWDGTSWRPLP